jgi:hypothetical protein
LRRARENPRFHRWLQRYSEKENPLRREPGAAHRRGLSAHPAVFPVPCPDRQGGARQGRPCRLCAARAGLDRLSAERSARSCSSCWRHRVRWRRCG